MPHFPEWRVHSLYQGKSRVTERIEGVAVHRFGHFVPRHHWAATRALYELSFMTSAARYRPRGSYDAVVAVVPTLAAGFVGVRYAARASVPFGLIFSDLSGQAARQSGVPGGRSVSRLVSSVEFRLGRRADAVAVISEGFVPYLESGGVQQDRIYRIVNANRADTPPPQVDRRTVRQRLGWSDSDFVVLHTGNIAFKQALDTVIEAASMLRNKTTFRFVLMGDGNRRVAMQRMARRRELPNIDFVPLADTATYPSVLASADVLLLHQRSTVTDMSLPGKLSNYLASGTAVVAAVAEQSAAAQEARQSQGALLIPPQDPEALVAAIERLANDEQLRRSLGSNAMSYASARTGSVSAFDIVRFLSILRNRNRAPLS